MLKVNHRAAIAGLLLAAVGAYVAHSALGFGLGTARRMRAGYFPLMVGIALVTLGLLLAATALRGIRETVAMPVAWRPVAAVLAGMVAFALLLPRLGLVPAVAALVALSGLGDADLRPRPLVLLTLAVAGASWGLFILLLRLPLPAFRWGL